MTESQKQDLRIMNKVPERLTMYGWEIKRGRCRGFCHNGHDFNMVVKDYYCRCYVCNQSFDIFDIVMFFENCTFPEAVKKIKAEMLQKQKEAERKDKRYWELWSKWIMIDTIIRYANPCSQLYADALHRREYLNYRMELEL